MQHSMGNPPQSSGLQQQRQRVLKLMPGGKIGNRAKTQTHCPAARIRESGKLVIAAVVAAPMRNECPEYRCRLGTADAASNERTVVVTAARVCFCPSASTNSGPVDG